MNDTIKSWQAMKPIFSLTSLSFSDNYVVREDQHPGHFNQLRYPRYVPTLWGRCQMWYAKMSSPSGECQLFIWSQLFVRILSPQLPQLFTRSFARTCRRAEMTKGSLITNTACTRNWDDYLNAIHYVWTYLTNNWEYVVWSDFP